MAERFYIACLILLYLRMYTYVVIIDGVSAEIFVPEVEVVPYIMGVFFFLNLD